jgi:hypothetical protein
MADDPRLNLLELWKDVLEELGTDRKAVAMTPVIFETSNGLRTVNASEIMRATVTVLERHGFVGTERVKEAVDDVGRAVAEHGPFGQ